MAHTKDADLWIRDTPENIERTRSALRAFGAPTTTIEALEPAATLDVVWMGAPPARIDLMKGVPGGDFDEAWSSRKQVEIDSVAVQLVGRSQLIALKRACGRPQDLLDADRLEQMPDDGC